MNDLQGAGPRALAVLAEVLDDLEDALLLAVSTEHVERPLIPDARLDINTYPDVDALANFRFTCDELTRLAHLMDTPNMFISSAGGSTIGCRGPCNACYRLSYPGKLSRIRRQFGRSDARIITDIYCYLDDQWKDTLFFNDTL
ncbi:hypothetical protein L914_21619 [Phytophthora nicotianae]|uniref:Uncharacterized protein n=1 Tax=Phytophthora nicotianae TaxID=4792 RepID=W2M546_PHYNI|nr:hypothetical protein L914_21619 [Phytophthora nicotianae]